MLIKELHSSESKKKKKMSFSISTFFLILCLYFSSSLVLCENYTGTAASTTTLDSFLQESAFKSLVHHRPQTGALCKAPLPANLSGMEVSIVRLRSRRLWNIGANFSHFQIPSRTSTMPHVKRMAIVYQDLGNWSSHYYNIPGYKIVTSVVGFRVFNASNARNDDHNEKKIINLDTGGRSIVINFSNFTFLERIIGEEMKCVKFSENGQFLLSEMDKIRNLCYSEDQGHFSIVVPLEKEGRENEKRKKKKVWFLWVLGAMFGIVGICLVGYFGLVSKRILKTQKIQVMERQANEDLVLQDIWVGNSKMPSATVTRTQPTIENGDFP